MTGSPQLALPRNTPKRLTCRTAVQPRLSYRHVAASPAPTAPAQRSDDDEAIAKDEEKRAMAQVSASSNNLDLDEDDVELCLGLSLGGSSRKRPAPILSSASAVDLRALDARDEADVAPVSAADLASMDPQKRRELHALRRQEARKKRELKKNGSGIHVFKGVSNRADSMPEKMLLEMQRSEARVRDWAAKENEGGRSENNVALTLLSNPNPNPNPSPGFGGYLPNGFAVTQPAPGAPPHTAALQYTFPPPPMGYVPFGNGFHYPYMMHYWGPATGAVLQQATDSAAKAAGGPRLDGYRAFKPFQVSADRDQNSGRAAAGSESGQNGSRGGGGPSTGSTASSSSAVSDNQSDSMRGGCSSDTRSHSSWPQFVQSQRQISPLQNPQHHQLEHKSSSHQLALSPRAEETVDKPASIAGKASSSKPEEPAVVNNVSISDVARVVPPKPDHPVAVADPVSTIKSQTKSPLSRTTAADGHEHDEGKKPEPSMPLLPHMPCVSTTGTGPNGKTITGFLYRYTKSEVSIVCVCHGSSFTPAEFVKHAGGTDVAHPLKHIVVVPSTFG
ncbi:hypothetical protein ACLOJK_022509 [Asimina triloba]